ERLRPGDVRGERRLRGRLGLRHELRRDRAAHPRRGLCARARRRPLPAARGGLAMSAVRLEIADAYWTPHTGLVEPKGGAAVALDDGGEAVESGTAKDLTARYPRLKKREGEGVLLPGLVDCHAHLECAAL